MEIKTVKVSEYRTNCYVLIKGNDSLVIDPGDEIEKIRELIGNTNVFGVLITHGHEDHTGAVRYFDEVYDFNNLTEGKHKIGSFEFEVIYTPGHTTDSVTYYFYNEGIMFTGDFLFKGPIGRTDYPTGSDIDMKKSLKKIVKYPDVVIYPGHGLSTSLENEKQNNVYFSNI